MKCLKLMAININKHKYKTFGMSIKGRLLEQLSILRINVEMDAYSDDTLSSIFNKIISVTENQNTDEVLPNNVMEYLFRGWVLSKMYNVNLGK